MGHVVQVIIKAGKARGYRVIYFTRDVDLGVKCTAFCHDRSEYPLGKCSKYTPPLALTEMVQQRPASLLSEVAH